MTGNSNNVLLRIGPTYQQTYSYSGAGAYQTYSCLPIPVGC